MDADTNAEHPHCRLGALLTEEEMDRVRVFLRQQGVFLPDNQAVARILEASDRRHCPFRYGFEGASAFCVNLRHLQDLACPCGDRADD
jgi:hypothetical protein